jgi:hypothetical protein
MNNIENYIIEKLKINKNTKIDKYHYHPKNKEELKKLILDLMEEKGTDVDLNDIDISKIDDLSYLFCNSKYGTGNDIPTYNTNQFNGDISEWDVSHVTNMECMFFGSYFDGDISKWNVSNVENMNNMFSFSEFTGNISKWDVSNVKYMFGIFGNSQFNGNINDWDVKKTACSDDMFKDSPLENNPPQWYSKK